MRTKRFSFSWVCLVLTAGALSFTPSSKAQSPAEPPSKTTEELFAEPQNSKAEAPPFWKGLYGKEITEGVFGTAGTQLGWFPAADLVSARLSWKVSNYFADMDKAKVQDIAEVTLAKDQVRRLKDVTLAAQDPDTRKQTIARLKEEALRLNKLAEDTPTAKKERGMLSAEEIKYREQRILETKSRLEDFDKLDTKGQIARVNKITKDTADTLKRLQSLPDDQRYWATSHMANELSEANRLMSMNSGNLPTEVDKLKFEAQVKDEISNIDKEIDDLQKKDKPTATDRAKLQELQDKKMDLENFSKLKPDGNSKIPARLKTFRLVQQKSLQDDAKLIFSNAQNRLTRAQINLRAAQRAKQAGSNEPDWKKKELEAEIERAKQKVQLEDTNVRHLQNGRYSSTQPVKRGTRIRNGTAKWVLRLWSLKELFTAAGRYAYHFDTFLPGDPGGDPGFAPVMGPVLEFVFDDGMKVLSSSVPLTEEEQKVLEKKALELEKEYQQKKAGEKTEEDKVVPQPPGGHDKK
jgi:hypothetical protein